MSNKAAANATDNGNDISETTAETPIAQTEQSAQESVQAAPDPVQPQEAQDSTQEQSEAQTESVTADEPTEPSEIAQPEPSEEEKLAAAKRARAKKIVQYVFSGLGIALVVFLLFVAITLAVSKFIKKDPVPSFFGTSMLVVTTGSMSGTIEDGDLIVVKASDEYKTGDIITFLPEGDKIPTTHRIIRITADGKIYTKGDANNTEDANPITKNNIIGKVTKTVPHVGLFFRWVKEESGWVYLVGIVVVIAVGIVLLKQFPAQKKEK